MTKTYAAPTVVANGLVVRETLSGINTGPEGVKRPLGAGWLGYDL